MVEFIFNSQSYFFSKHQVDSGLIIDEEKVGLVNSVSVQGADVDLLSVRSSIASTNIEIYDINLEFTKFIGTDPSGLIGREVKVYIGLVEQNFDFSEYIIQSVYFVRKITQKGDVFSVQCQGSQDEIQKRTFTITGNLFLGISDSALSAQVTTGNDIFPSSGYLKIDNEFMQYTGKSFSSGITTFTGLARGDESSEAVAHEVGTQVFFVQDQINQNPIDILLRILLSTGNGSNGPYDVLVDGLSIPQSTVLVSKFEQIRNDFFFGDEFTLFLYDIPNTLKYLEKEIFLANNIRLTEELGKMSLAVLDQSLVGADLPIINSTNVTSEKPSFSVSQNEIVNVFDIRYFYSEGRKQFTRTRTFRDNNSIALYGERRGSAYEFKGIRSDAITTTRGNRFLNRFKTPMATIEVNQLLETFDVPVGEKVLFSHPHISVSGARGMSAEIELLKKSIDYAKGVVRAQYVFTSYFNIRRGLIAPCRQITEVIDSKTIRIGVNEGRFYQPTYGIRLYDPVEDEFLPEPTNYIVQTITDPIGDILVLSNDWNSVIVGNAIRFSLYEQASQTQRARYAFISPASGVFADGSGAYKIF